MAEQSALRKEMLDEMMTRKKLGDKKFHSESSLQNFDEDAETGTVDSPKVENDPGVLNAPVTNTSNDELGAARRRTMSQPGPVSGSLLTATAARAARRRPPRNVAYAEPLQSSSYKDSDEKQNYNRLTVPKGDDSGTATPTGDRSPLPNGGAYGNSDIKSLNSYRIYASNTPRKRSVVTMDAQSLRSVETQAPPPTSPEDNKRLSNEYLTLILSCIYAILLVTVGLIIFVSDPFVGFNASPIYCLFLSVTGFAYLIVLLIDINRYKTIALKNQKIKAKHEEKLEELYRKHELDYNGSTTGDRTPVDRGFVVPPPVLMPLKHHYCFSQGRHAGSFYLKMGATAFALGHLVHSLLLITVQISYFVDDNIENEECVNIVQVVVDFFYPLYSFFQLYFIFKYSNVIILRWKNLARFGFMHYIGSSICFWLWAIVRETMLALTIYAQSQYGNNTYDTDTDTDTFSLADEVSLPKFSMLDVSSLYDENCVGPASITAIYENFSPYLYPFSVEYNILIVGIYYIIWHNIGECERETEDSDDIYTNSSLDETNTLCKIPTASEDNDFTSNFVIHADCHASNRGLFAGMIVTVILVGMLILGFIFSTVGEELIEVGYLLSDCTKLGLHVLMLLAVVMAYNQTRKLDINLHPISLLDDILLFVCLPAFFMETIFTMVATVNIVNVIKFTDVTIMSIQVIIQTAFLVDGLRRCSNMRKLRRTKPGRELLMFLLIANVAMWIFNTFSYKSPESLDERYTYYGKVLWSVLGHISLPLIMFYRFHSSVCFADIWDSAYKPGSEH